MSRDVKSIQEVLEVLRAHNIAWATVNRIQNSLWVKGIAFFSKNYLRVAYYDERNDILFISRPITGTSLHGH